MRDCGVDKLKCGVVGDDTFEHLDILIFYFHKYQLETLFFVAYRLLQRTKKTNDSVEHRQRTRGIVHSPCLNNSITPESTRTSFTGQRRRKMDQSHLLVQGRMTHMM